MAVDELVTAPDERERCCAVRAGVRCRQPTAWRFAPPEADEHEQELYAYSCGDCAPAAAELLGPGFVMTRVR